jgi:hypothetical protein
MTNAARRMWMAVAEPGPRGSWGQRFERVANSSTTTAWVAALAFVIATTHRGGPSAATTSSEVEGGVDAAFAAASGRQRVPAGLGAVVLDHV